MVLTFFVVVVVTVVVVILVVVVTTVVVVVLIVVVVVDVVVVTSVLFLLGKYVTKLGLGGLVGLVGRFPEKISFNNTTSPLLLSLSLLWPGKYRSVVEDPVMEKTGVVLEKGFQFGGGDFVGLINVMVTSDGAGSITGRFVVVVNAVVNL